MYRVSSHTADGQAALREAIDALPREDQMEILFHLLDVLLRSQSQSGARPRRPTLDRALGLLATDRSAPTDAEVQQWLEEHRQEKYG